MTDLTIVKSGRHFGLVTPFAKVFVEGLAFVAFGDNKPQYFGLGDLKELTAWITASVYMTASAPSIMC